MSYQEYWSKIKNLYTELDQVTNAYWQDHSSFGEWQFWAVVAITVIPLLILIKYVDRERLFEVFFFGFAVHIMWNYAGDILELKRYFIHTYFLAPMLPSIFNMAASALPVAFLLVYQYCTNHDKNFYLWIAVASAVFAFGIAYLENLVGLVEFGRGFNYFHLFLVDLAVVLPAYWFTRFLVYIKRKSTSQ